MEQHSYSEKFVRGFYSEEFIRGFRGFFKPLSHVLVKAGVTPNTVTFISLLLGAITGIFLALDYLWTGLATGIAMGFADIIDGQLAKEYSRTSKFGAILDSTIDRYNEFFLFAGFAVRYYLHGRELWIVFCALVFLGSTMISYVRARSEAEGFDCKVGRLQRPERLTIVAFGTLFRGTGIDVAILFLAIFTQITAFQRLMYVYHQSRKSHSG